MQRPLVFAIFFLTWLCATLAPAASHPLGNFTINHLAKVSVTGRALRIRYVLDIAEIPTFQIMQTHRDKIALAQWADQERALVRAGLHISIDGVAKTLQPGSSQLTLRPGAGGLPIIRWVGGFTSPLDTAAAHRVKIDDTVYADRRIGWKDIVVGAQSEPTNELRSYPNALVGSPRRVNSAAFTAGPGAVVADVRERADDAPVAGTLTAWVAPSALSDMFSRPNPTVLFTLLTVLAAFGLGALHALEPGHGKALLAFTLVGARATAKQAITLAVSLTVAHTAGVLLLGLVLFFAAGFVSETIYPWITLVSGGAIAVIGARSLARYVRLRRGASHAHAHGHAHDHTIPGSGTLNFRSALWAAMSGGIAPCPAAIVVLLAALRLHHVGYGIFLIVVFSMGLASILSGLGIAVVRGAAWLSGSSGYARVAQYGPLFTALVISTIGAVTLASGFAQQGIPAPTPLVAVLALAAIAGYAVSQQGHTHGHGHAHGEAHAS
jgi:ABC-type nickel/cobalt efflux system permease component RcnA